MCAPGHVAYRHTTIGVRGFGVWAVWGVWAFFFKREIEISKSQDHLALSFCCVRFLVRQLRQPRQSESKKMENLDWPHWSLFGFDH
jgi:hypothetical protein